MAGLNYTINTNTNRIFHLAIFLVFLTFLYVQTGFCESLNSSNENDIFQDSYNKLHTDNFNGYLSPISEKSDHQQLAVAFQLCFENDQASDLCYLLAEDIQDYQNLGHEIELNNYFTDYAQTVGVVSLPVFLRYLPALSRVAKNNMILTSVVALVGGAIVFKKYYDAFSDSLIMKVGGFDRSLPTVSKSIEQLKSSKVYNFYSQKGPENNHTLLYLGHQKDYDYDFSKYSIGIAEEEFNNFINRSTEMQSNSEVDKYIDVSKVQGISDQVADIHRSSMSYKKAELSSTLLAHSLYSDITKFYREEKKIRKEYLSLNKPFFLNLNPHHDELWDALLLEIVSHFELLQENHSPIFEQNSYIPFLKAEIESLSAQENMAKHMGKSYLFKEYADSVLSDKSATEILNQALTLPKPGSTSSNISLLPSTYFDFLTDIDATQVERYFAVRSKILNQLLDSVENRLNVWKRAGEYQIKPGQAQSERAFSDWADLFRLAHNLLLHELYENKSWYEAREGYDVTGLSLRQRKELRKMMDSALPSETRIKSWYESYYLPALEWEDLN